MDDNVVYLGGKKEEKQDRDEAHRIIRGTLLDVIKSFRAGEIRAIGFITFEKNNAIGYRIAGECTDAELVAALEYIKFRTMVEV